MRRFYAGLLTVLMLMPLLTACGGTESAETETTQDTASQNQTETEPAETTRGNYPDELPEKEESVPPEVILPSADGFAIADVSDAVSVYQDFLHQITWTDGEIEPRFNLCYIDEDAIPELVVFTDLEECEYTNWDLLYTKYDYTVYTIFEGRLTELLTGGMEITPVGGLGDAVVFEPRQNRLLNRTYSYRGAYEEIRQIHNGTVEVVESGYTTYTGAVSGLYVAELYLNGVVRSAFAETEDSPEYAAYLSLSDEINAWMAENDNRQWVRRDPEVSFPVSAENGIQEALPHAND